MRHRQEIGRPPAPFHRVTLLFVLAIAACTAPTATSTAGAGSNQEREPGHFADGEVAFNFPATWHAAESDLVTSFIIVQVYLSTAPLTDPCVRTPNSRSCAWSAVSKIEADGVFVIWYHNGSPTWTFDPTRGEPLTVGGLRATLEAARGVGALRGHWGPTRSCRHDRASGPGERQRSPGVPPGPSL